MQIIPISTFTVGPNLPENLRGLETLAYNLWWSWDREARELFKRLDPDLWVDVYHNPVKMLGSISQERLDEVTNDEGFLSQMYRVLKGFEEYLSEPTWYQRKYSLPDSPVIAYFSMEFGLTECLPFYSGGLGVLSGDHMKSASELGLPLVGVGLLYQLGYFKQYLNADGWQGETYPVNDFHNMPIILERDNKGDPLMVRVEMPGREVFAQIWRVQVGKVSLYLMDTNVPENSTADRKITAQLYGGDKEMRIQQEFMLGIGGVRTLHALGFHPLVYHMNEGHAAFLGIERIRGYMEEKGLTFQEAIELTKAGNVFTTHTPVPAGIDVFPETLIDKYFKGYYGFIPKDTLVSLGRGDPENNKGEFSMAVLALRLSGYSNGVSRLHGRVSRAMWKKVWPDVPEDEVPISHVTNGIHYRTWVSKDMAILYDRYLGPDWIRNPSLEKVWKRVEKIPPEELWRSHERRRGNLISLVRERLKGQLKLRGAPRVEIARGEEVLNPDALTIGFARRFATYKRATLILRDLERLKKILYDEERPVQIVFAGKAHPQDHEGKDIIKEIIHLTRHPDFRGKIVFIADYDHYAARQLLKGCDVWLNTPIRNQEASGTSGMKAAANGILNMSTLDGWWDEACDPEIGWTVGKGEVYDDQEYQNKVESNAIYDLLEQEVIPLFYDRGHDGIPRGWIDKMKKSMKALCPVFSTNRMVYEYHENFYRPAEERYMVLSGDDMKGVKDLAGWKERVRSSWPAVNFGDVTATPPKELRVGSELQVEVDVDLGGLTPDDVSVEVYSGRVDMEGGISYARNTALSPKGQDGNWTFAGRLVCINSGLCGYTLRILPKHPDLGGPFEMGLIKWKEVN